jgi:hypothetical protein
MIGRDEYLTNISMGTTNPYTISAYVYDGTTGNVGGDVGSTQAQLYFNNSAVGTTYTDAGGGLVEADRGGDRYREYDSGRGTSQSRKKTVYVDGVQVELASYLPYAGFASTYIDGSLGVGYTRTSTTK